MNWFSTSPLDTILVTTHRLVRPKYLLKLCQYHMRAEKIATWPTLCEPLTTSVWDQNLCSVLNYSWLSQHLHQNRHLSRHMQLPSTEISSGFYYALLIILGIFRRRAPWRNDWFVINVNYIDVDDRAFGAFNLVEIYKSSCCLLYSLDLTSIASFHNLNLYQWHSRWYLHHNYLVTLR